MIEYINDSLIERFARHDAPAAPHEPYRSPARRVITTAETQRERRVVWEPQDRQREFLRRPEYEVLYGGAAGGGKTDALLIWLLGDYRVPHYNGLFLRKTYPELEQAMTRSIDLYPRIVPGARFNENKHVWRFPSGARVYMSSNHRERDIHRYQGRAFDRIGLDESTHFTFFEYSYLFSRNRPSGAGTMVAMRCASNPGGVGHAWVKGRFISNRIPGQSYRYDMEIVDPRGNRQSHTRHRCFIPATVFDNAILLSHDPAYVASMAMLPEAERQALLYGSWDSFSGQAFPEWRDTPVGYRTRMWSHVIEDFRIPETWRIFRSFDFGYAKPYSVNWYAMDNDGRLYKIREAYGCTETPNTGVREHPGQIAERITMLEREDPLLKGKRIDGIADPSIWDSSRGESIAQMMERAGVYWRPGDNQRIAGKAQMHYRLAFDADGFPMFYVFRSCRHTIRTLPSLVYDETHVEDIDTDGEDHIYDADRYLMMDHPIPPREHHQPKVLAFDPLDLAPKNTQPTFIQI